MSANSTKRTITKILSLYLGTSIVLLCWLFYFFHKQEMRNIHYEQIIALREISLEIRDILKKYKNDPQAALPEILESHKDVAFGIFGKEGKLIFSNLLANPSKEELREGFYRVKDKVIMDPEIFSHKKPPSPTKYRIFIQDDNVDSVIMLNNIKLGTYFVLVLLIMGVVAYFLVKLFLKPISDHIEHLDTFIKDTTHEINTPISIILMSIERLKNSHNFSDEDKKKILRIKLASLQLEHIYRTLVAYNFPQNTIQNNEELRLDNILQERLEFFTPFFAQKDLHIKTHIKPVNFIANRENITTLFDNLISNAIKYNTNGGSIEITLYNGYFSIKDSGCGIDSKDKEVIFERFERRNTSLGGFGIGLSLVKQICKQYNIQIQVQSTMHNIESKGSSFILIWKSL